MWSCVMRGLRFAANGPQNGRMDNPNALAWRPQGGQPFIGKLGEAARINWGHAPQRQRAFLLMRCRKTLVKVERSKLRVSCMALAGAASVANVFGLFASLGLGAFLLDLPDVLLLHHQHYCPVWAGGLALAPLNGLRRMLFMRNIVGLVEPVAVVSA